MSDASPLAAVLTISDRCSRGEAEDTSGPALVERLADRLNARVIHTRCLPDDSRAITELLWQWVRLTPPLDLVLTTGGTGLSPRDVTPEATARVLDRDAPGLMELARLRCYESTPLTFLSRGIAGVAGRTLIVNLPGSKRGAVETFDALADVLPHAIQTLRGTPDAHPPRPTSETS